MFFTLLTVCGPFNYVTNDWFFWSVTWFDESLLHFVGFSLSHTSLDYFSVTSISFLMAPLFQTIRFHVGQPTIFQVCLVDTVAPPALQFCTSSVKMGVLYAEQTLHKHFYSLTQTLRCQRVTAPQSYLFACNIWWISISLD